MSTFLKIAFGVVVLAGCNPGKEEKLGGARLKTVTIGTLDLRAAMNGPATDAEKDAILTSLKFQIKIKSVKCDKESDSVDKTLDSVKWNSTTIDSIKVARNCSYIISMNYIDGNGASLLASQTDKENLTKEELAKDSPKVGVKLIPTDPEGVKYWLKEVSTSPETGVGVNPTLGQGVSAECKAGTGLDQFNEGKLAAKKRDEDSWRSPKWGQAAEDCAGYDEMVQEVAVAENLTWDQANPSEVEKRKCHNFGWAQGNLDFLAQLKIQCHR